MKTVPIRGTGNRWWVCLILAAFSLALGFAASPESNPPETDAPPPRNFKDWNAEPFFGEGFAKAWMFVEAVKPLDSRFDLIVAVATETSSNFRYHGIFLVKRDESVPSLVLDNRIIDDSYARPYLLEGSESRVVFSFSCDGPRAPKRLFEFVYSLAESRLIAAYPSATTIHGMAQKGSEIVILADDGVSKRVLHVLDSSGPFIEVAHTFKETPSDWTAAIRLGPDGPEVGNEKASYILRNGKWELKESPSQSLDEQALRRRLMHWGTESGFYWSAESAQMCVTRADEEFFFLLGTREDGEGMCMDNSGIVVLKQEEFTFLPIPQPTEDAYYTFRPMKHGTAEETIDNLIGPRLMLNGKLLFGISFYDGEGSTGLGGWGSFDFTTRKFDLHYPSVMAHWATTAILAVSGTLWFGLANHSECCYSTGGVLHIGALDEVLAHYPLPEKVTGLARCGDAMIATGTHSVFRLAGGKITRAEFRHRPDGSLEIVTGPLQVLSPAY